MSDDPKVSRRYRELPREEPPRHVDEAILAAARRTTKSRPAPLVVPAGRRRWYFPLAAAAVIMLAVAVTLQVERQQPDPEVVVAPATVPAAPAESKREEFAPEPKPAAIPERRAQRDAAPLADLQKAQPPAAPAAAAPQESEQKAKARAEVQGARDRVAAESRVAGLAAMSPEQWLQGIADLRRQNRDDEADRQLAEFRKRYPDYRISKEMLDKVEKK